MSVPKLPDGEFEVRMLIDRSSIEIFINEGQYVMTALIFPNEGYNTLKIDNHLDAEMFVKDFWVSKIKRIW